ncbi:MAG: hypothetical protein RIQ53_4230 [Pseudomonadota bacterium]|jgi:stringent starvation protein B
MNSKAGPEDQGTSTRPYLIRALHDWCSDNGFTPYIAVCVTPSVQVPMEHVRNNEIVLNVGFEATSGLRLGNESIEFKARFGGKARDISVPVDHVVAIYARENGQGMAFPMPAAAQSEASPAEAAPAPVAAARGGLRLAGDGAADDAAEPVVDGAAPSDAGPLSGAATEAGITGDEPPPAPPAPAGGRPMLKRVK